MRILIADDVRINRILVKKFVSEYGECVDVENGLEALKAIIEGWKTQSPFDIIFLDIIMPVLDGMETLKKIRDLEKKQNISEEKQIKIIMTTSKDDKTSILNAVKFGAVSAYLVKPVSKEKLDKELFKLNIFPLK